MPRDHRAIALKGARTRARQRAARAAERRCRCGDPIDAPTGAMCRKCRRQYMRDYRAKAKPDKGLAGDAQGVSRKLSRGTAAAAVSPSKEATMDDNRFAPRPLRPLRAGHDDLARADRLADAAGARQPTTSAERLAAVGEETAPLAPQPALEAAEPAADAGHREMLAAWLLALYGRLQGVNDVLGDAARSIPGGADIQVERPAVSDQRTPRLYPIFRQLRPLIEAELEVVEARAQLIDQAL